MTFEELCSKIIDISNWDEQFYSDFRSMELRAEDKDFILNLLFQKKLDSAWTSFLLRHDRSRAAKVVTVQNGIVKPEKKVTTLKPIRADELEALDLPPINWICNGILPEGVAILSAPPKSFKSYMMLDLCTSVCRGGSFLEHSCTKAGALYFDLESGKRRPRDRLKQILSGEPFPKDLLIVTGEQSVARIGEGFEEQVEDLLNNNPNIRLMVIDVLKYIRPASKRNQNAYDSDYETIKPLVQIAANHSGLCIVLVTHDRKMRDISDWTNNMSGSTGLSGAVDVIWRIDKEKRDSQEAELKITGRDVEGVSLRIEFDKDIMKWHCLGTAEDIRKRRFRTEYMNNPVIRTIKKGIEVFKGQYTATAAQIIRDSEIWQISIHETPQKVAKEITKYTPMLRADGISHEHGTGRKSREITFTQIIQHFGFDDIAEGEEI